MHTRIKHRKVIQRPLNNEWKICLLFFWNDEITIERKECLRACSSSFWASSKFKKFTVKKTKINSWNLSRFHFAERISWKKKVYIKQTMLRYHLNKPSSSHIWYMTRKAESLKLRMPNGCISAINQIITRVLYQVLPFESAQQPEIKGKGLTSGTFR